MKSFICQRQETLSKIITKLLKFLHSSMLALKLTRQNVSVLCNKLWLPFLLIYFFYFFIFETPKHRRRIVNDDNLALLMVYENYSRCSRRRTFDKVKKEIVLCFPNELFFGKEWSVGNFTKNIRALIVTTLQLPSILSHRKKSLELFLPLEPV